jgi:glyoxylase-like metal-dependent hydrolase (beta-lactamase superfamily II)
MDAAERWVGVPGGFVEHDVVEVAADVFLARGTAVNFVLVRQGSDVTLLDSGWSGDAATVVASVRAIGARPEDVRAVLLTHAHLDHVGGALHLFDRYGVPTYTGPVEVAHAHRDYLEQAGPLDVARNLWRPGAVPWTVRIMRKGALKDVVLAHAQPFPRAGALDLPGAPVPVATPGHTSGHTAYHLPSVGAVVTGDGLVTGHPMLADRGPQVLPAMFNHGDPMAGLGPLAELDADLLLPGHGDDLRGPIADAVATARERASR